MAEKKRYQVRRTLSYALTLYGSYVDLESALGAAENRSRLGYPSEVLDTQTGERYRPPYWKEGRKGL